MGVRVFGVYLSKGTTVGNKKANSEKKTGTVYLNLFSEKVVLCVVFCCVLCCVVCWVVLCYLSLFFEN